MNLKFKVTEWRNCNGSPAIIAMAKTAAPDEQLYTKAPNTLVLYFLEQSKSALLKVGSAKLTFAVVAVHDIGPAKRVDVAPLEAHPAYFPRDNNTQEFYVPLGAEIAANDTVNVELVF